MKIRSIKLFSTFLFMLCMTVTATFCSAVTVFADDTASSNKYLHGFEGYYFLPDIPNADPASSWMGDELTIYEITADYVSFDYQHPMRGHSIVYTAEKAYFTDAYTAVANGTVAFADTPYDTVSLQFTLSFSNNSIRLHIIPQNATGRDRTITFTSSGIVYPEEFTDVPENHWAHDYIMSLTNNGIIMGYEDGDFKPDNTVTRAEWSKMLVTAFNISAHEFWPTAVDLQACDIYLEDWYAEYVFAAEPYLNAEEIETPNQPIILYHPLDNAIREDVAESLAKVKLAQGYSFPISQTLPFTDADTITDEGKPYVAAAVEFGLISGFEDNTFRGQDPVTRAEAAALLWRAMNV